MSGTLRRLEHLVVLQELLVSGVVLGDSYLSMVLEYVLQYGELMGCRALVSSKEKVSNVMEVVASEHWLIAA